MTLAPIVNRTVPPLFVIFWATDVLLAQQVAFPGAEGYGKYTVGGRGGAVYEVTTLNPTGPGSLGDAIAASGPRTVVFKVSGTIAGNFKINNPNITIAGQTAPGDGICIKGYLDVNANDVNLRYLRVRADPSVETDATGGRYHNNIILDHVSASWSSDEAMSYYHNSNVTVQWCVISEACAKFVDGVDTGHRFGGIWGNDYGTYHHNLIASNDSRNPRWASGSGFNDYRNNVVYNWGYQSSYGGEAVQPGLETQFNFSTINMVANYYKPGPATASGVRDRIVEPSARSVDDKGSWYVAGNVVEGAPAVTADNWQGVDGTSYIALAQPWTAMPINQQSAQDAYTSVLASAGCSLPARDSVDTRIIQEVRTGTATFGNNGIITTPADVGGWPVLKAGAAPLDSDHDGMPDAWELAHGLNRYVANNNADSTSSGYTDLEKYLNELGAFPATSTLTFTNANASGRYAQSANWSNLWQPSRFDAAQVAAGTVKVDAPGQHARFLTVGGGNAAATLNITSGWIDIAETLNVGATGANSQTVNHSNGLLRAGSAVIIGGSDQPGSYNLAGGTLATPLLTKGAQGGSFNFTGGTLHANVVSFDLINDGGILAPGSDSQLQLIAAASMPDSNGQTESIQSVIGSTHVIGNLTLRGGSLEVDLASLASFDSISVDGTLSLGGSLLVVLDNGFLPSLGDQFRIGTAGTVSGNFASVPMGFTTIASGRSLYLVAIPEPMTFITVGLCLATLSLRRPSKRS